MHEDQALPASVKRRVLALHRYAIALKQGDVDGVAAQLQAAEHDHALESLIQEFNAVAQEEDHILIPSDTISSFQEFLQTYRPLPSPGEPTLAEESLPTDIATLPPYTGQLATGPVDEKHSLRAATPRRRLATFAQTMAAVLIVAALVAGFLVLFASHQRQPATGNTQLHGPQEEIVVIADANGLVSALRASNHTLLWQQKLGKAIMKVILQEQTVYVATISSGFSLDIYAFNATNGALNWHRSLGERIASIPNGVLVDDGLVIISYSPIYALDARSGQEVQQYPNYRPDSLGEWLITAHNGIIYAADTDKHGKSSLVAFQSHDKKFLWQYTFPSYIEPESVSIVNNMVYIHAGGGNPTYLAALHNENGSVLWLRKLTVEGPTLGYFSAEGNVIYFYANGHLCAYRTSDGSQIYCKLTDVPLDTSIGTNGSYYTGFVVECLPHDPHKVCQPYNPHSDRSFYEIEARDAANGQTVQWLWSSALTTNVSPMHLAVLDGQLYAGTSTGLYALRARDGRQQWYLEGPTIVSLTAGSLDE